MRTSCPRSVRQTLRTVGAITLTAIAGSLLVACTDDAGSLVAPNRAVPVKAVEGQGNTTPHQSEFVIKARFDLNVDVEGSLKPGQPIHLKLKGTANFATQDADVRLSLPEVSAAERSSWDAIALPVGQETVPHLRLRRGFTAGENFHARATLTIPRPGYYFVAASAEQLSDDRATDLPYMVSDVSQSGLWLWISEEGGKVTAGFDSTLFMPDDRKERGPRTKKSKPSGIHKKGYYTSCSVYPSDPVLIQACPGGEFVPPSTGTASHSFSVAYDRRGSLIPAPGVRYVWELKASGGQLINTGHGWADASGNIPVINCEGGSSERTISIRIYTLNNEVKVIYKTEDGLAGGYDGPCGGATVVSANPYMAELFVNYLKTVEGHKANFGALNPSRIFARLIDTGGGGYVPAAREIRIPATNEHVYGSSGVLVAVHEWGHWWQDATLFSGSSPNGLVRYFTSACPVIHPTQSATTLQCAFMEGFADWYAVVVRGSATGWVSNLENNFYHLNCQPGTYVQQQPVQCSADGSVVQGAIHSFLHDLTDDTPSEGWDFVRYNPSDVAAVIRDCWVRTSDGTTMAYDGIDHLILCMEGRLPYQLKVNGAVRTLFPSRVTSRRAQSYRGSSLALGSDFLRRTWLVNLYSKEYGTDPDFERGTPTFYADYSIDPNGPDGSNEPPPEDPTDPSGCGTQLIC